jgi:glycosyltransferase involved in cell wall biosynthesis
MCTRIYREMFDPNRVGCYYISLMSSVKDMVSIVIVVKNDRGISDTLEHLFASKTEVPYEVIVIDGSRPDRLSGIKAKYPKARWDQFPYTTRRTTPEQRNRGIELARGDIIAFIDANCIPSPDWISAIRKTIDSGKEIVCGPVLDSNEANLVHYAPAHTEGRYVDECTTISVGIRRIVIDTIGGFDPSFSFGQDIDFFWRAQDAGYRMYYDPEVAISHDWGERKEQLGRAYQYGKARAHLFKKHWSNHRGRLIHEPHVWMYPLFILGLPLTYFFWPYPLLIFVPVLKNLKQNPFGLVVHHLYYGWGVLAGALKKWPSETPAFVPSDTLADTPTS